MLTKLTKTDPLKVIFVDTNPEVVHSLQLKFLRHRLPLSFQFFVGNILEHSADAIVSPANSFGFMDGGIDLAYLKFFGKRIQENLQQKIQELGGELLVGQVLPINTGNAAIPIMLSAPTMRVPTNLSGTINVYLAMRGILRFLSAGQMHLDSILIPGLGTGSGCLSPLVAAHQIYQAFIDENDCKFPESIREAVSDHYSLTQN